MPSDEIERELERISHVYIGRIPGCGCPVAGVVDRPGIKEEWLADFDAAGYEVERLPADEAPPLQRCTHKQAGDRRTYSSEDEAEVAQLRRAANLALTELRSRRVADGVQLELAKALGCP